MASSVPEFLNQNTITDNDDVLDSPSSTSTMAPRKNIKPSFELLHPLTEEGMAKMEKEIQERKLAIEKARTERFDKYKMILYIGSVVGLFLFSYKRWFPLIGNPFF